MKFWEEQKKKLSEFNVGRDLTQGIRSQRNKDLGGRGRVKQSGDQLGQNQTENNCQDFIHLL